MTKRTRIRKARRAATALLAGLVISAGAACDDTYDTSGDTMTTEPTSTTHHSAPAGATTSTIATEETTLHVTRRGSGPPLLLIHGGGENAAMHGPQAEDLASAGFEVITYDRRGTGGSGREDWPGSGAAQHADDAADLLRELGVGPATIVGVSSGGVVALSVAARHPEQVHRVIAWEPPAAGVVPGGAEFSAQLMQPVNDHLAAHPGDFEGAQAVLLSFVLGFPVSVDDPAFAEARKNAEPMVRDEPTITLASFTEADFRGVDVTLAVGSAPNELIAAALPELSHLTGSEPVAVEGEHQIYLSDPSVLTSVVTGTAR